MIKNKCILDFTLKPNEVKLLNDKNYIPITGGIYVLFIKREPMYIGRSDRLGKRIQSHLSGNDHKTNLISNEFDEVGIKFCDDQFERDCLEAFFIADYNPVLNIHRQEIYIAKYLERNQKHKCLKKECSLKPHGNGMCARHGGNGVPFKKALKNQIIEEYYSDKQLKLII